MQQNLSEDRRQNLKIMENRTGISFMYMMFATIAIAVATACRDIHPKSILPDSASMKPGDIAFRTGVSIESNAVIAVDTGVIYSHVGIVVDSAGTMMIVHAVPNEHEFKGDFDRVKMDRPELFFRSDRAKSGRISRFENKITAEKAAKEAIKKYYSHTKFDYAYNDKDTTKLYCSELITFCYRKAGLNINTGHHNVLAPGIETPVVLPTDLLRGNQFKTVIIF